MENYTFNFEPKDCNKIYFKELFLLMTDPITNAFLEQLLIETYFPNEAVNYRLETTQKKYSLELEIKE
jgi:hypothetical protein